MFVLQAAVVQGRGGITTALSHYERMFRDVGVRSAVVYRGPSTENLRGEGIDILDAPELLTSPIGGVAPLFASLRGAIEGRARGEPLTLIVHSDRTLPALRRLFPHALIVTPCHSDKFKHKSAANLVVTLNAAQHAMAQARLPNTRVRLLGNPYVAPPAASPAGEGAPRLNFVARFIPTKDPMALMRAAALLGRTDLEFRFIGAGPLEADLRAAAVTLNVRATFPGWLTAPFEAFHRNDLLVLPSHWEGLPYLIQEALDHGVPVIASDNPGNEAALGGGAFGLSFRVGDAEGLAGAITKALGELDALRGMSEKGRAALRAKYGAAPFWQAMRRELDECAHV